MMMEVWTEWCFIVYTLQIIYLISRNAFMLMISFYIVLKQMWNPLGIVGVITAFNFPCAVLGETFRSLDLPSSLFISLISFVFCRLECVHCTGLWQLCCLVSIYYYLLYFITFNCPKEKKITLSCITPRFSVWFLFQVSNQCLTY